eukprot:3123723-Lingulodinium_polyedra.AAC.1
MEAYLWAKAKALVEASHGKPVLYTYGSDGTPILTQETVSLVPTVDQVLYRRGHEAGEYLVERGFLIVHAPGG